MNAASTDFVVCVFYNHLPLPHWEEPIYSTEQSLGVTLINHTVEKSGNVLFSFFYFQCFCCFDIYLVFIHYRISRNSHKTFRPNPNLFIKL